MPEAAGIGSNEIFSTLGLSRGVQENKSSNDLALDDFMKLMVTQLNNQDPFEPMENGDFLAQIAQFGAVAGLDQLNDQFSGLASSITSGQAVQAGNLVGRRVLAPTDQGVLIPGQNINGQVTLEDAASDVTVRITDVVGQAVKEFRLGAQQAGSVDFSWDGLNNLGVYAPAGTYKIEIAAQRGGESEGLETQIYATVESVSLGKQGEGLTLNLGRQGSVAFDDIQQIN